MNVTAIKSAVSPKKEAFVSLTHIQPTYKPINEGIATINSNADRIDLAFADKQTAKLSAQQGLSFFIFLMTDCNQSM